MKVYINGKFVDEAKASVSVFDHGLLYGDGLFEGIENEVGRAVRLTLPPTIIAGEDVDHEGDIDHTLPA